MSGSCNALSRVPVVNHQYPSLVCNDLGMALSIWTRQDWDLFAAAIGRDDKVLARAGLHRFLIGIALREEQLNAHELGQLLDLTDLDVDARTRLADEIEFALGLLAAYDRLVGADEDDDQDDGSAVVGLGDLVI